MLPTLTLVQVTSPQNSVHDLVKWIAFYRQKGIYADIQEQKGKISGVGIRYSLWRALTVAELDELDKGLTEIQSNSLVWKHYDESVKKSTCGRSNKSG
jgi:hypothetical protein